MNKFEADKIFRKGKVLCASGDVKGLELMNQAIVGYGKGVAEFLSHRAFWRLEFKLYEKAVEDATKALKIKPNIVNANKVMFEANFALGRISDCKKAITSIQQTSPGLQRRLKLKELNDKLDRYLINSDTASHYFAGKNNKLLVEQSQKNLQIAPKDGKMLFYLTFGLFNQHLYDEVVKIDVSSIRNTIKEEEVLKMMAKSLYALNRIPEAVAILYKSGGQFDFQEEMRVYTRIQMLRVQIWENLASNKQQAVCDTVNECRRLCKTIGVYNNTLRFEIQYASYKFYLGRNFPSEALKNLEAAVKLRPTCIKLLEKLFDLRFRLKEYADAKQDCLRIIQVLKKENKDSSTWEQNFIALNKYIQYKEIIHDKSKMTFDKALSVFGLASSSASSLTVKQAYFKLVRENHPDKQGDSSELMKQFSACFTKILNDAKSLLDQQLNNPHQPSGKSNLQNSRPKQDKSKSSPGWSAFFKSREEYDEYMFKNFYSKRPKV